MAPKKKTTKKTPPQKEASATAAVADAATAASTVTPATPQMKAKAGEGMNPVDVSKMLGLLKYKADDTKNKKGVDMEEAKTALELYKNMGNEENGTF